MIVTISCKDNSYDIMTNPENTIRETLRILEQKGMIASDAGIPEQIYSERKKKNISVDSTYQKSGIYQGDILTWKDKGAV